MLRCVTVAAVLLVTTTYAGLFDEISGKASDVGNFFTNQFNNVKDLFANDQSQLETNIARVQELLTGMKEKMNTLVSMANDEQKRTLARVDGYLNQVSQFSQQVASDGKEKFDQNSARWQQMLDEIFRKGGLDDVLKLSMSKSGAQYTAVTAALVTVVLAFYC